MTHQKYGSWGDLDQQEVSNSQSQPYLEDYDQDDKYQPVREIVHEPYSQRGVIRRNAQDRSRDFLYWFGSNGGFRTVSRIITILAIFGLIAWIVSNSHAIFDGFIGFISELLPIALVVWLLWHCLRVFFNPR